MGNFSSFMDAWSKGDYVVILIVIAAAFMGLSLLLRVCCAHKIAIDTTLIQVICIALAIVILGFHFDRNLIFFVKIGLMLSSLAISIYILIDNAAASLATYDKPKQRFLNFVWSLGFYITIGCMFLL